MFWHSRSWIAQLEAFFEAVLEGFSSAEAIEGNEG